MSKNKTLRDHASGLADSLAPHVENARDKAGPVFADARDKAAPVLADARDKVTPVLAEARDKAAPFFADARDKAAPVLADARDKAAPLVADAKDKITSDVLPAVVAALAAVDSATEDARAESLRRGTAVVAALKGEVEAPRKKRRKLPALLVVLGLGGIAFAVAKLLGGRQPTTSWQSSYTPPPAPVPPPAGGPVAGGGSGSHRAEAGPEDTAASDPAEAASDATDVPHPASTPDSPVTEVDVDKP